MAITNEDVSGAAPSSWSAALDQIAAGTIVLTENLIRAGMSSEIG
jgi:hypothetical protein